MRVIFAADHAGYELKEVLKSFVEGLGHTVVDVGAHAYDAADDYIPFMKAAAAEVAADPATKAIILGKSGEGEAMVANRTRGVRAAVYYGGAPEIITLSREHNDANALSLGAAFLNDDDAKAAVKVWLETPFSGEARHARRIAEIDG